MNTKQKGFTLIEIIVVLVIITILAAIAVPSVTSYIKETEKAKFVTAANTLLDEIQVDVGKAFASSSGNNAIETLKNKYSLKGKPLGSSLNWDNYINDFIVHEIMICFDGEYQRPYEINSNKKNHSISKIAIWFRSPSKNVDKFIVIVPNEEVYWYPDWASMDNVTDSKANMVFYF